MAKRFLDRLREQRSRDPKQPTEGLEKDLEDLAGSIWDALDEMNVRGITKRMEELLAAEERGERVPFGLRQPASELQSVNVYLVGRLLGEISQELRREGRTQAVREVDSHAAEWREEFDQENEPSRTREAEKP